MTRKKIKVQYIANDTARKSTFKKRRNGLFKKAGELSTLCDVDVGAVVFNPFNGQPEVWPDNEGARRIISRFRQLPPVEQTKKLVSRDEYISQQLMKAREELKKTERRNREMELEEMLDGAFLSGGATMVGLAPVDMTGLVSLMDDKIKRIQRCIQVLRPTQEVQQPRPEPMPEMFPMVVAAPLKPPAPAAEDGGPRAQWPLELMNNKMIQALKPTQEVQHRQPEPMPEMFPMAAASPLAPPAPAAADGGPRAQWSLEMMNNHTIFGNMMNNSGGASSSGTKNVELGWPIFYFPPPPGFT